MTHFTSNFQRLKPMLQRVVYTEKLTERDKQVLVEFQKTSLYSELPKNISEAALYNKTSLFLLKQAADSLLKFARGDNQQALQIVKTALHLPLKVDPFRGFFYCFAAKIAQLVSDTFTNEAFTNRYRVYCETYELENALLGAAELFDPQIQQLFDEMLTEVDQNQSYELVTTFNSSEKTDFISQVPYVPPVATLTYISRSKLEQNNPKVRIFSQPHLARFVDFEAQLIRIEPNHEFLEISFELLPSKEVIALLANLQNRVWTLRFIANFEEEPLTFTSNMIEVDFSFSIVHLTFKQPKSWQELALIEEINWESFWFGLTNVVFIAKPV